MAGLESGVPRGLRLGEVHGSSVLQNSKRGIRWAIPFMAGLESGVPRAHAWAKYMGAPSSKIAR